MVTDPVADLLTRMRNACKARKDRTSVRHSKLNLAILEVLKKQQMIEGFNAAKEGRFDAIEVIFKSDRPALSLRRISKPGQRIYLKCGEITPVRHRYGIAVFSTPKGVMSGDEARKAGIGGEYLCQAW